MLTSFLQKQVEFIQNLCQTLAEMFEEKVEVEFIHTPIFSAAVIECESESLVGLIKRRLFNWQLENTSHWDEQLIRITDLEGKCTLTDQSQQTMTSQS